MTADMFKRAVEDGNYEMITTTDPTRFHKMRAKEPIIVDGETFIFHDINGKVYVVDIGNVSMVVRTEELPSE